MATTVDRCYKYPDERLRVRAHQDSLQTALFAAETLFQWLAVEENPDVVGVCSSQCGLRGRVVCYKLDDGKTWGFLINPIIISRSDEHSVMVEGCGSVVGAKVRVKRPNRITVSCDASGSGQIDWYKEWPTGKSEFGFSGFEARIIMHEIDHLDGILITDYGDTI